MTELVFYDQRLPLKRRWSAVASDEDGHSSSSESSHGSASQRVSPPPLKLPRLPSLAVWAGHVKREPSPVDYNARSPQRLPPVSIAIPFETAQTETPAATPTTAMPSTATKAKVPMRNTSRERMKAEQAALRAQAASLETELSCLRQLQHDRMTSCSRKNNEESDGMNGWQEVAQRQWERRVQAERENKKLRATVTGLMDEVKGLQSLFKSRSSALMASLKQHSQLAGQLETLLASTPGELPDSPSKALKEKKAVTQSPRDVSMEPWRM